MPGSNDNQRLDFEKTLERLRAVVEALEEGNLGLEESLKLYEEGVSLARVGHGMLESAEKRIAILVGNAEKPIDTQDAISD